MSLNHWMAWEGGVDLVAKTSAELDLPNVIVHVARMVHTPVGSAPGGMLYWQPDPAAPPLKFGFVSPDTKLCAYFSEHIFAGTPFHGAPSLQGKITIEIGDDEASALVEIPGAVFETRLSGFSPAVLINRSPLPTAPFYQQGLEAVAAKATLVVNDEPVEIVIPSVGMTGGPCAVLAATGLYAR